MLPFFCERVRNKELKQREQASKIVNMPIENHGSGNIILLNLNRSPLITQLANWLVFACAKAFERIATTKIRY